jgi:hypothetical protein
VSGAQHEPDSRQVPDGARYPPQRKSKAPRPTHQNRNDNRISWITGGVIAAVFVVSVTALVIAKKSTAAPPGTSALPATGVVLWTGTGSDLQHGPLFTVPSSAKGWLENWTFNCRATGHPGTFITTIHGSGSARTTTVSGVHAEGMGGSGTNHYDDTGTFSISVDSACGWTDRAVAVP